MKYFALFILLTFSFLNLISQEKKLNSAVFRNYIKPNSNVSVQTVSGERVQRVTTSTVDNITIPDTAKKIILYQNRIAKLDALSLKRFNDVTDGKLPDEEVKVIPEVHVESANGNTEATTYRVMFTMQQPLIYDDRSGKFSARLGFLLISDSGNANSIKEPVKIEVRSNEIKIINPDKFTIDHLSIPSTDVSLEAEQVTDSISVRVGTVSNPEGYITFLKVRPSLEIYSNRQSLQGLGVQEIPVTVRLKGSTSSDSVNIVFSAEKGTITPKSIYVSYNKPVTVLLRSEGLGDSKLTASTSALNSNDLIFKFIFPWYFLLASLAGGLLGGVAKFITSDKKKKSLQKILIGGILVGLIVALAFYGLGISLIGIKISATLNEIAVMALSAIGAFFGISLPKPE
jgi:hypothetical protein